MKRRVVLFAVLALAFGACTGDPTPPAGGAEVIGPIILGADDATVEVTAGRTVVFDVEDPADWELAAEPEALVEISQGGATGDAVFNPGVTAKGAGEVVVTLTQRSTGETRTHTLRISAP